MSKVVPITIDRVAVEVTGESCVGQATLHQLLPELGELADNWLTWKNTTQRHK